MALRGDQKKFEQFFWTCWEEGSGSFSDTVGKDNARELEYLKTSLLTAVDTVPFDPRDGRSYVMADYGCQDGGTTMPLLRHLIERVRRRFDPSPDISIWYEDQPYNDFKSLFLLANGLIASRSKEAWSNQRGIYFAACGRSFYEQCFPDNTVHIGISAHAVHHLSTRPCPLPDVLHYSICQDEKKKALFAAQGAADWQTFLLHRSKELVSGGSLAVAAFCTLSDGQCSGATVGGKNLYRTLRSLWEGFYEEGRITKDEVENSTYNYYERTVEEFKAPFRNKDSPVYRAGLRLLSIESKVNQCGFQTSLKERGTGDPEIVADLVHKFVMHMKTFVSGDFLAALSSRSEGQRKALVDDLFRRFEEKVGAEPWQHKADTVVAYIVMRKTISE